MTSRRPQRTLHATLHFSVEQDATGQVAREAGRRGCGVANKDERGTLAKCKQAQAAQAAQAIHNHTAVKEVDEIDKVLNNTAI